MQLPTILRLPEPSSLSLFLVNPSTQFHFSLGEKTFFSSEMISSNFLPIHPAQFYTVHTEMNLEVSEGPNLGCLSTGWEADCCEHPHSCF